MDLFKQLSDGVSGAVKTTMDVSKGAIEGGMDLTGKAVDMSKGAVQGGMDMTSKATGAVAGPLGDVANATVMKIPGAESVKEASEKATAAAMDVTSSAVGTTLDATKGGLGVMMAGVNGTFETVGVNAGFQSVMTGFGVNVDTSDEGLEKLHKELDADGSGNISKEEMTKAIEKLYAGSSQTLDEKFIDQMMAAADTDGDGEISLEEFKVIMRAGPKDKVKAPTLKPKTIMGMNGDKPSGKPDDCIAYCAEGSDPTGLIGKQFDSEVFTLTDELKEKGLSAEDWEKICTSLREAKNIPGVSNGFSTAIGAANDEYLTKIGCVGAYAEYGLGQKAFVVLTKEVADGGRVAY